MDGSMFRAGPSTLEVDIADGSILQDLTVHANAPYRGWFSILARTFLGWCQYRGWFDVQGWTFHT